MTVIRIDQVIPSLVSRDAIGGHVVQLRDLLRTRGYQSDIYYGNATPDRLEYGFPVDRLGDRSSTGRVLLYQLSIGSGVADIFRERSERKFVNYHNITPADLIEGWVPAVGEEVRWGRAQLRDLAPVTEFAIADSAFNERELQAAGYRSTKTVPLLIDLDGFDGSPDPVLAGRLATQKERGGPDLLFVGKVSPHKGQHDLVKALAAYRRLYDPDARLHLVGGAISDEYQAAGALRRGTGARRRRRDRRLGEPRGADRVLHGGRRLRLPVQPRRVLRPAPRGHVPRSSRRGLRQHGGARDSGGAGLILPNKEPVRVAAAIDRVVRDAELRSMLAEAARERVASFALPRVRDDFVSALEAACAA